MRPFRLRHLRSLHTSTSQLQNVHVNARRRLPEETARHVSASSEVELLTTSRDRIGAAAEAKKGGTSAGATKYDRSADLPLKPTDHAWKAMDTSELEQLWQEDEKRWGIGVDGTGESLPNTVPGSSGPQEAPSRQRRPRAASARSASDDAGRHSPPKGGRRLRLADNVLVYLRPDDMTFVRPSFDGSQLNITTTSYARLRDACPCPICIHPTTRQKTHTSAQAHEWASHVPSDPLKLRNSFRLAGDWDSAKKHADARVSRRLRRTSSSASRELEDQRTASAGEQVNPALEAETVLSSLGLRVRWPHPGGAHESVYPLSLLERLRHIDNRATAFYAVAETETPRSLWNSAQLQRQPDLYLDWAHLVPDNVEHPRTGSETIQLDKQMLHRLLVQLQRFGIVILRGVPTTHTADADCTLRHFVRALAQGEGLRNTFYGATWDVMNRRDSRNVAYTDLNLGLHMDLLYFSQPPRFQLLHCLRNRVQGGGSYFVDAFAAAASMYRSQRPHAEALAAAPLLYEYDNDGRHLAHAHPVLPAPRVGAGAGAGAGREQSGVRWSALDTAVNWSPPFQAPQPALEPGGPTETKLYAALAAYEKTLDEPHRRFDYQLQEGDMVVFDNRRVLHARTAFRDYTDEERRANGVPPPIEGEPSRWLKGGYMDGETVWDRLVMLHRELHE